MTTLMMVMLMVMMMQIMMVGDADDDDGKPPFPQMPQTAPACTGKPPPSSQGPKPTRAHSSQKCHRISRQSSLQNSQGFFGGMIIMMIMTMLMMRMLMMMVMMMLLMMMTSRQNATESPGVLRKAASELAGCLGVG